jgi:hypothetical protein
MSEDTLPTREHIIQCWDETSTTHQLSTLLFIMDKTCERDGFPPDFYVEKNEEVLTGVQSGKYFLWMTCESGLNIMET